MVCSGITIANDIGGRVGRRVANGMQRRAPGVAGEDLGKVRGRRGGCALREAQEHPR